MYRVTGVEQCYRCFSSDLVIDNKAGDRICTTCGEVQQGRLIDEDSEHRQYPDDADSKKQNANERSSGNADSVSGNRFHFVGGTEENLAALSRSSYSVLDKRERAITHVTHACKEISYALNLTKCITVGFLVSECFRLCSCSVSCEYL